MSAAAPFHPGRETAWTRRVPKVSWAKTPYATFHEAGRRAESLERDEQAGRRLEDAQRQLAERRQQARRDLLQERMSRIEHIARGLLKRQASLADETSRMADLGDNDDQRTAGQLAALEDLAKSRREMREFVDEYTLADGRNIYLLGEGRLINLAAAEGHPSSVMDMSFANQALAAEFMVRNAKTLEKRVYDVPVELDQEIARLKLESLGTGIDELTPEQEEYLSSWQMGITWQSQPLFVSSWIIKSEAAD